MTIAELTAKEAALRGSYCRFSTAKGAQRQMAGRRFMEWLAKPNSEHLPTAHASQLRAVSPQLLGVVTRLLAQDSLHRATCAECLEQLPFSAASETSLTRNRELDRGASTIVYKGTLCKLNTAGNKQNKAHWLERDCWITGDGDLCYFSLKENRRLVLLSARRLRGAIFEHVKGCAHPLAFRVAPQDRTEESLFAVKSENELHMWMRFLQQASTASCTPQTLRLGSRLPSELRAVRIAVRNRRLQAQDSPRRILESKLWKLKSCGDARVSGDWHQRVMWLTEHGDLVYWSEREGRPLVYLAAADLRAASPRQLAALPHGFELGAPARDGLEFTPARFAAASSQDRDRWLGALRELARQ